MRPTRPGTWIDQSATDAREAARLVRSLLIARLVAFGPAVGLPIALIVMLVVGIVLAITAGQTAVLASVPRVLPPVLAFAAAGWFGVPRIDGRVADLANDVVAPDMCAPLIELLNGLPIWRHRGRIERGLARSLACVTPEWWEAHARLMRDPVRLALSTAGVDEGLKPADGPWLTALLDAIDRAGRTEFLQAVEAVVRARRSPDERLGMAAQRCAASLRDRIRRDREAATLLRPAPPPDEAMLLRPARGCTSSVDGPLLRPASSVSAHCDADESLQSASAPELQHQDSVENRARSDPTS